MSSLACTLCSMVSLNRTAYFKHVAYKHLNEFRVLTTDPNVQRGMLCFRCDQNFVDYDLFCVHLKNCVPDRKDAHSK